MFASALQTTDVVLSTADNKATLCSSETRNLTSALHKSIPIVCCANIAFFLGDRISRTGLRRYGLCMSQYYHKRQYSAVFRYSESAKKKFCLSISFDALPLFLTTQDRKKKDISSYFMANHSGLRKMLQPSGIQIKLLISQLYAPMR